MKKLTGCATRRSLLERRDVIVASGCIYGLGSEDAYYGQLLQLGLNSASTVMRSG